MMLEQVNVPAVPVITEPFRNTARAMAESWGNPDFPTVEVPHPIAGLGTPDLEKRADALVEEVLKALMDPRRPEQRY